MFVRSISGIDHAGPQTLSKKLGRAGRAVAQYQNVGVKRLEIARGVLEGFAFGEARTRCGNVNDIGAEPEGGEFERGAGPRARFDEEINQGFSAECRNFFDFPGPDLFEGVCRFKNEIDLVRGEFAEPKQILAVPVHSLNNQTASGSLSIGWRRT